MRIASYVSGANVRGGAVRDVPGGLRVAVQVLAHHRGAVAGPLQGDREGVPLFAASMEGLEPALEVAVDVGVVGKVAGEDRRARGAAQRVRDEVVGESDALALHGQDVRHVSDEIGRQVVRQDEHDVRPPREPRGGGWRRTANCGWRRGQLLAGSPAAGCAEDACTNQQPRCHQPSGPSEPHRSRRS